MNYDQVLVDNSWSGLHTKSGMLPKRHITGIKISGLKRQAHAYRKLTTYIYIFRVSILSNKLLLVFLIKCFKACYSFGHDHSWVAVSCHFYLCPVKSLGHLAKYVTSLKTEERSTG